MISKTCLEKNRKLLFLIVIGLFISSFTNISISETDYSAVTNTYKRDIKGSMLKWSNLQAGDVVLFVSPSSSEMNIGETKVISIDVANVVDLYGFEFKLKYDTYLLDAIDVAEGDFLKSGGDTFVSKMEINDTAGYVWVVITLMSAPSGVSGNGTLATITFKAINSGISQLGLYDTILGDSCGDPIPHTVENGTISIGGKGNPPSGGMGGNGRRTVK